RVGAAAAADAPIVAPSPIVPCPIGGYGPANALLHRESGCAPPPSRGVRIGWCGWRVRDDELADGRATGLACADRRPGGAVAAAPRTATGVPGARCRDRNRRAAAT